MVQSYGSLILLLPVHSEAVPQTCEDPKGCWRGTWEREKRGAYIWNSLCMPLNLQPVVNTS